MTDKVIRDGKVAVLVSPSYGAGWSSWALEHNKQAMMFSPKMVEAIEANRSEEELIHLAKVLFPDEFGGSGITGLEIKWVPLNSRIRVIDYDGAESIEYLENAGFVTV
jgi:hypothetical protein